MLGACHPSASVERTMPVANLQSYRSVALSVRSTAFASQGTAMQLEAALTGQLQQKCGFATIHRPDGSPVDVMIDLNVVNTGRGGGRVFSNSSEAYIDTLLVLTDGPTGDLMGTAKIRGKSSGMIINGAPPENEAIAITAQTIANLLAKSGCSGPRVARTEPNQPTDTTTPQPPVQGQPPIDESKRPEAERLNEDGKMKMRTADVNGALAAFQQAVQLIPDGRYQYNVCLAYETLEQWPTAVDACKKARTMTTEARLIEKIDHRLDLLAAHQ
jgi:hypothetical protein